MNHHWIAVYDSIIFYNDWAEIDVVAYVPTTSHAIDLIPTRITWVMFKIQENIWVDVLLIQNRLTVRIFYQS